MNTYRTIKTQEAIAHSADFEEYTWTFQMNKDFEVAAGAFVIVDKAVWDKMQEEISDMRRRIIELTPVKDLA